MTKSIPSLDFSKVAALVYDGLCTFEFGIVAEIFGLDRPEMGSGWYQFKSVSLEDKPLKAMGGLSFHTTGTLKDFRDAGTIIIPGWRGVHAPIPENILTEIQNAASRGVRIVSICSGVFVLAAAGLLSGRRATTHWRYAEALTTKHPDIDVDCDSIYVSDGNLFTSAGSSAGIDLCLHIVRQDFGAKKANSVARRLVMQAHREGGQMQYVEQPVPKVDEAHRLSDVVQHIHTNLAKPHRLADLSQRGGMSPRTFQRKFTRYTGMPVTNWILTERLGKAREMLETTAASLESISEAVGLVNSDNLRYHFRNKFGVSPTKYRKKFSTVF